MSIQIPFKNLKQVQEVIEVLEQHNPPISVPWNYDIVSKLFLEKKDLDTVRWIFSYFFRNSQDFYEYVFIYFFNRSKGSFKSANLQIYFEELNKVAKIHDTQIYEPEEIESYIDLYSKYKTEAILDFLAEHLFLILINNIKIDENVFKLIVQRIDRSVFIKELDSNKQLVEDGRHDDGYNDWQEYFEIWKQKWITKYDKAAKERAVDVSLGLGYAQFDNQAQSTIPSLVLQQIVNESVDVSGIPAQDVYKLVKHINEGTTNKTIRLGQPSNFTDAKEEAIKITRLGLSDSQFKDASQ